MKEPRPWIAGLVIPVVLGLAWEGLVRAGLASGRLMPPPTRLVESAWALTRSGELQTHVLATMTCWPASVPAPPWARYWVC